MTARGPRSDLAILGRWEAGESIERIARATGVSRERVRRVIGSSLDAGEQNRAEAAIRGGSIRLLAALRASAAPRQPRAPASPTDRRIS